MLATNMPQTYTCLDSGFSKKELRQPEGRRVAVVCRPKLEQLVHGSLGSQTALMKEPYSDDSNTSGIRLTPYTALAALVQEADAAGLQVLDYSCAA